jgi:hypothetical protein
MNYSFSIVTGKGDEYRIMFIDADISLLAKDVRDAILKKILIFQKSSLIELVGVKAQLKKYYIPSLEGLQICLPTMLI